MVASATALIEGVVSDSLWFHYDVENDVLYLQIAEKRGQEMFGEETPDGLILLRTSDDGGAGMTIVNWWRRFGKGSVERTSLTSLRDRVAESARALTSAAWPIPAQLSRT